MRRVRHPNIVMLKEFVQTTTHYVIVMDLMRGGDLFERLESQSQFMEEDARLLIVQVAGYPLLSIAIIQQSNICKNKNLRRIIIFDN